MADMVVESARQIDLPPARYSKHGASHGEIEKDPWAIGGRPHRMNDTTKMSSGPARRILIVDDNPRLLRMLEMRFSESGYRVMVMERVKDALIAAITEKPDLIVADVAMPDISGWEFKKLLNNIPSMTDIPFIFLTTNESLPLESYTEEFGPIDHLRKPYSFEELLAKVETNLKRKIKRDETKSVESEASRGTLDDMTLVDVMQVLAMNRKTCSITLVKGKEVGKIYFREGRLLDAKRGNLRGDDAVYELLGWRGADFSIGEEPRATIQVTVTKDLHALIAEGLQRIEEAGWLAPLSQSAGRIPKSDDAIYSTEKRQETLDKFENESAEITEKSAAPTGGLSLTAPANALNVRKEVRNSAQEAANQAKGLSNHPKGPANQPERPANFLKGPSNLPEGPLQEDTRTFLERMKKLGLIVERT
jgi:DNA-binding response OmpR family regulator